MMVEVVIIGLAGWRIAAAFCYERGPWDVFLVLRGLAGIAANPDTGEPAEWEDTFWASLLSCVWCLSVWTCGAMALLWLLSPVPVVVVAAAAVAVAMERWCHG